jgi:CO/xanthine dehydrogenase Mo-binding subunit
VVDHAVKRKGEPISGRGRFVDKHPDGCPPSEAHKKNIPTFAFGTQVAEVEVDAETGTVKVLRITAAHDLGRVVNRAMAEGQVEGSVVQGVGYALMENMVFKEGTLLNDGFLDYKLPRVADVPNIETILIESEDPDGPFGAKGVGEPAIVPTAAAIANAIHNACGVRVRKIPILPEDLLKGLKEQGVA